MQACKFVTLISGEKNPYNYPECNSNEINPDRPHSSNNLEISFDGIAYLTSLYLS